MIFDADNHYYEPEDCFTRYMAETDLDDAVRLVDGELFIGDRPFTFLLDPFAERGAEPGSLRDMLQQMKAGTPIDENTAIGSRRHPPYVDRDARLDLMAEQGVDAMVLFPTLAVCVEHFMRDEPQRTYRNVAAFNQWLADDWGHGADGIHGVPLLSLLDVDAAVDELERVMDRGARFIHLRPGPQGGKNPADPIFDPFWSRVDEAGLTVCFHISESGFNELYSVHWGEEANPSSHQQSAFQWTSFYGDLPIMQTIAGLTFWNFFGRFPRIRVMSVENGSLWVPYLLAAMDKMKGMGRNGPWPGGYVKGRPSEILRQKLFVSPYHEEDIVALVDTLGASQVLFGSDYPHPEGLAEPLEFRKALAGLDDDDQQRIMGENLAALAAAP